MNAKSPISAQAHVRAADAKTGGAGRSQIGARTSEIRRLRIGRELFAETM